MLYFKHKTKSSCKTHVIKLCSPEYENERSVPNERGIPMLKMATIVRVKRKRNAEAVQNILVSCKKAKTDEAGSVAKDDNVCQSYLKFAGTVTSKVICITESTLRTEHSIYMHSWYCVTDSQHTFAC